jgi:hypothetical protein
MNLKNLVTFIVYIAIMVSLAGCGAPFSQRNVAKMKKNLIKAASKGNEKKVNSLLDTISMAHGLSSQIVSPVPNGFGAKALFAATKKGHTDIVKALLKEKTDIELTDADFKTAIDIANENGHTDIVNLLKQSSAKTSIHVDASGRNEAVQIAITSLHNQAGSEHFILTSAQQIIVQGQYIWRITFKPENLLPKDPSKGLLTKGGEIFVNVDLKTKTTKISYGE